VRAKRWLTVLALAASAAALGDTVTLKDGRVIEGEIVERSRTKIVMDALISNITMRMEFRTSEIESIEEGEAPEPEAPAAEPERPERRTRAAREPAALAEKTEYLLVPIKGVFGEEVGPSGVERTLEYASRRGIEHVVFEIDSPGGAVWAAEAISEAIAAHDDTVRCYALVDDAISASIWVAFNCDRIFVRPDGVLGGAVAYRQDTSTGSVEVDAKLNSILAARVAGICERNGHPEAVARAMILHNESLYASHDGEGGYYFSNDGGDKQLDDESTVVTLTGEQVEEYKIGTRYEGDAQGLGEILGHEGWTLASDFGEASMRRGRQSLRQRAELARDHQRLMGELQGWSKVVEENDPSKGKYIVHEGGTMTQRSIHEWQRRTDACVRACEEIRDALGELRRIDSRLKRLGYQPPHYSEETQYWLEYWDDRIDGFIRDLRAARDRVRL